MNAFDLVRNHYNRLYEDTHKSVDNYTLFVSEDLVKDIFRIYTQDHYVPDLVEGQRVYIIGILCIVKISFPPYTIISFSHEN